MAVLMQASEFMEFLRSREGVPDESVVNEILDNPGKFGTPKSKGHVWDLVQCTREDLPDNVEDSNEPMVTKEKLGHASGDRARGCIGGTGSLRLKSTSVPIVGKRQPGWNIG